MEVILSFFAGLLIGLFFGWVWGYSYDKKISIFVYEDIEAFSEVIKNVLDEMIKKREGKNEHI